MAGFYYILLDISSEEKTQIMFFLSFPAWVHVRYFENFQPKKNVVRIVRVSPNIQKRLFLFSSFFFIPIGSVSDGVKEEEEDLG